MPYSFETTEQRSNLMKRIKCAGTKAEVAFAKALWAEGIRYRKNYRELPGKPDIAITKYKLAVFIDGEFWHGFQWEQKKEKIVSNREYWINKIVNNMHRDEITNTELEMRGWTVLRFWEHEVNKNLKDCVEIVLSHCKQK